MGLKSAIEWTESTWNPVTGCTKVSPGCKHCYAERMAERLRVMGQANYFNGFELTLQPHMLELPLRWKKPQTVFVNSRHAAPPRGRGRLVVHGGPGAPGSPSAPFGAPPPTVVPMLC